MNWAQKIKNLCEQYRIRPEKTRGQHFLIDDSFVKKMVDAAGITKKDTVVEVGSGFGILTEELVKHAGKVIAVEIEEKMVEYFKNVISTEVSEANGVEKSHTLCATRGVRSLDFAPHIIYVRGFARDDNGLEIHHADIRRAWNKMPKEPYSVIANLPYNITSQIIRGFLEKTPRPPEQMVLMVQKEVADRIVAKPGDMSLLALSVQWFCSPPLEGGVRGGIKSKPPLNLPLRKGENVRKLFKVPKGAFWPQPEVDSAVIQIKNIHRDNPESTKQFFALANRAFKNKRKMLTTTLVGTQLGETKKQVAASLKKCGIAPKARPQELSIKDWDSLVQF